MQRCTHPLGSRHAHTHAGCGLVRLHRPLVLSQLVRVGQKRGALSGTPFPLTTAPVHSDSSSYFRSFPPDDGSASPLIHAATYRCARYGMPFLHVLRRADVHIHRTQCSPGSPTPKYGIFCVLYCPTLTHTGSCRPRLSAVQYGRSCLSPPIVGVLGVVATVCYSQYLKNAVLHCPTSPHTVVTLPEVLTRSLEIHLHRPHLWPQMT